MSNILLINDMPSFGKVALAAMNPILSFSGHKVFNLPTALVSNTLDYGKFEIMETTEYMQNTLAVWEKLGFEMDCICTGFIVSIPQSEWIASILKSSLALKVVDPIMADDGKLYNGIDQTVVTAMRNLCAEADIVIPNVTEACYLTGLYLGQTSFTEEQVQDLIEGMRNLGSKSVVITSVFIERNQCHCVCGYDHHTQSTFALEYEHVPVRVPGTGDIFSSVLVSQVLKANELQDCVQTAMNFVVKIIVSHPDLADVYRGVTIEQFLDQLPKE